MSREFQKKMTSFWLHVVYALNLRVIWASIARLLMGDTKKAPLKDFATPQELQAYLEQVFEYGPDPGGDILFEGQVAIPAGWFDYPKDPEHFQWLLNTPGPDGDCDCDHWYIANQLIRMKCVQKVYFMCSGFVGGAHATAVYMQDDKWFHFDYRIYPIDNPNDAPMKVALRYTTKGQPIDVMFWTFETVKPWKVVAISPKKV